MSGLAAEITVNNSVYRLAPGIHIAGRGQESDIQLPFQRLSRMHARFRVDQGTLTVTDLGSSNGTFINNQRITGEYTLAPGDRLLLGDIPCAFTIPGQAGTPVPEVSYRPARAARSRENRVLIPTAGLAGLAVTVLIVFTLFRGYFSQNAGASDNLRRHAEKLLTATEGPLEDRLADVIAAHASLQAAAEDYPELSDLVRRLERLQADLTLQIKAEHDIRYQYALLDKLCNELEAGTINSRDGLKRLAVLRQGNLNEKLIQRISSMQFRLERQLSDSEHRQFELHMAAVDAAAQAYDFRAACSLAARINPDDYSVIRPAVQEALKQKNDGLKIAAAVWLTKQIEQLVERAVRENSEILWAELEQAAAQAGYSVEAPEIITARERILQVVTQQQSAFRERFRSDRERAEKLTHEYCFGAAARLYVELLGRTQDPQEQQELAFETEMARLMEIAHTALISELTGQLPLEITGMGTIGYIDNNGLRLLLENAEIPMGWQAVRSAEYNSLLVRASYLTETPLLLAASGARLIQAGHEKRGFLLLKQALRLDRSLDDQFPLVMAASLEPEQEKQADTETENAVTAVRPLQTAAFNPERDNNPRITRPLDMDAIPDGHPRLFFRNEPFREVPSRHQALERARSGFQAGYKSALQHDNASHMAFKYLLTGDEEAARRAVELMKQTGKMDWFWTGVWTSSSALAYDWLYNEPFFTAEDKQAAEKAIMKGVRYCLKEMQASTVHPLWNGYWICAAGAVTGSVALHGHNGTATREAERLLRQIDTSLQALDYVEGAWLEGPTYAHHAFRYMLPAVEAFWSATGENPYTRHPGLPGFVRWYMWMTRMDSLGLERWDDAGSGCGTQGYVTLPALAAARATRDPEIAWYARTLRMRLGRKAFVPEEQAVQLMLFTAPEITDQLASAPQQLSRTFGPGTAGYVMARSGWKKDDNLLVFRSGQAIAAGHQHPCVNAFTYYHRASLAIDSGMYHGSLDPDYIKMYTHSAIAHNVIVFPDPRNERDDGGQRRFHRGVITRPDELKQQNGQWNTGQIIAHEDHGGWAYMAGEAGWRAYDNRCRSWVREIVLLRPSTVIILDRAVPAGSRRPVWLLHTIEEPRVQGPGFRVSQDAMDMNGVFLLPQRAAIEVVGGDGREFWNRGRNWLPSDGPRPHAESGRWRIEVSGTGEQNARFLCVMRSGGPLPRIALLSAQGPVLKVDGVEIRFSAANPGRVAVGKP